MNIHQEKHFWRQREDNQRAGYTRPAGRLPDPDGDAEDAGEEVLRITPEQAKRNLLPTFAETQNKSYTGVVNDRNNLYHTKRN